MSYNPAGLGTYTLSGSISSTQTSITLSSFKVPVTNTNVTMASMSTSIAYGTISPGTSNSEFISFTGITQNANGTATLTGVTRGLDKQYPGTEVSGFKRQHSGQSQFILSNSPNLYFEYAAKSDDNTLAGNNTFSGTNTFTGSTIVQTPTLSTQAATKGYVDGVAVAGAPNASTTVKGIIELATQAEVDARTTTGGTGALLVPTPDTQRSTLLSDYKVDTGSANAYVITPVPAITAYTAGQIFSFKATNTNTTASTLNVNGLGVKTIKKGNGTTDLASGDIVAGQVVIVEYDGTNFQMLSPSGNGTLSPTGDGSGLTGIKADKVTCLAGYTFASNTTENTTLTTTITGNSISTTGVIRVTIPIITGTTNASSETITVRLKLGGSTIITGTISAPSIGGGTGTFVYGFITCIIANNSSLSSQNVGMYMTLTQGAYGTNVVPPTGNHSVDTTSAIDTSTNQTLAVTVQRSAVAIGGSQFYQSIIETLGNF